MHEAVVEMVGRRVAADPANRARIQRLIERTVAATREATKRGRVHDWLVNQEAAVTLSLYISGGDAVLELPLILADASEQDELAADLSRLAARWAARYARHLDPTQQDAGPQRAAPAPTLTAVGDD